MRRRDASRPGRQVAVPPDDRHQERHHAEQPRRERPGGPGLSPRHRYSDALEGKGPLGNALEHLRDAIGDSSGERRSGRTSRCGGAFTASRAKCAKGDQADRFDGPACRALAGPPRTIPARSRRLLRRRNARSALLRDAVAWRSGLGCLERFLQTAPDRPRTEGRHAGRTPKSLFDLSPARTVVEDHTCLALRKPSVAPSHQRDKSWRELQTHLGQSVLMARRVLLVRNPGQDATVNELGEAVGEHRPGDTEIAP